MAFLPFKVNVFANKLCTKFLEGLLTRNCFFETSHLGLKNKQQIRNRSSDFQEKDKNLD